MPKIDLNDDNNEELSNELVTITKSSTSLKSFILPKELTDSSKVLELLSAL